jgi:hypothetical protein
MAEAVMCSRCLVPVGTHVDRDFLPVLPVEVDGKMCCSGCLSCSEWMGRMPSDRAAHWWRYLRAHELWKQLVSRGMSAHGHLAFFFYLQGEIDATESDCGRAARTAAPAADPRAARHEEEPTEEFAAGVFAEAPLGGA